MLELSPTQKALAPLPAVSKRSVAGEAEPGLEILPGARRLSCGWREQRKGMPTQNGAGRSWNEQTQHLPYGTVESRMFYLAETA